VGVKLRNGRTQTIPSPIYGWNTRDPLEDMDSRFAVRLDNWVPGLGKVSLRRGSRVHATGMGSVETIAEYAQGNTIKMIAAGNGKLWDASAINTSATELASGFTSNIWQHTIFGGKLLLVNGTDQPQQYNGSAVSAANYTGISNDANLVTITSYKSRVYAIEKHTLSVWYGALYTPVGALSEYTINHLCQRGSYLVYAGPWDIVSGGVAENYFIFVTNRGEIIVCSGLYPADTSWKVIGKYVISSPLGYRAFCPYFNDLLIGTYDGIFPLSSIASDATSKVADKINDVIASAYSEQARENKLANGWQIFYHDRGNMLIANVPQSTTSWKQHVMNVQTSAWWQQTNCNGVCWGSYNNRPYYGDSYGRVIECDVGNSDLGDYIPYKLKTAFSACGDPGEVKIATMARAVIRSTTDIDPIINLDVNFGDETVDGDTLSVSIDAPWDTSPWDLTPWPAEISTSDDWRVIGAIGSSFAAKIEGKAKGLSVDLNAIQLIYQPGGAI
jgi:hypothetical protein